MWGEGSRAVTHLVRSQSRLPALDCGKPSGMQRKAIASAHHCNNNTQQRQLDQISAYLWPAQSCTSTKALGHREQRRPFGGFFLRVSGVHRGLPSMVYFPKGLGESDRPRNWDGTLKTYLVIPKGMYLQGVSWLFPQDRIPSVCGMTVEAEGRGFF